MKLLGYKRIHGIIRLKSGLRIGMSNDQMAIGDVDNPVIRNPLTEEPYIPGSSLKGKMRYLLEWHLGGDYIAKSYKDQVYAPESENEPVWRELKDPVGRIFGQAPNKDFQRSISKERGPTRLLVRDAYLTSDSKQALERMTARGGYLTEVKQEVFIPRIGGNAIPRTAERVPVGAEFAFEMVYRVMDTGGDGQTDRSNFEYVKKALELLKLDGLGSYISRGYGQVELPYEVEEK